MVKGRAGLTKELTATLYGYWQRINTKGVKVVFADFDDFLDWAIESNFLVGKRIGRIDATGPFSRDNCVWMNKLGEYEESDEERAARWDALVEPIREQFKDTLAEIEKKKQEEQKQTVFRYEHPDLVREGIVWRGTSQ